ncbi:MAG TPA: mechanosensitive ion channel [Acholeplasma sp.]|jgi:small-conductance mechanosensitive channel|nr:mechanosensitive ion channel [Acholeplasma sp.]
MEKEKKKLKLTKQQITWIVVAAVFVVILIISIFATKIFGDTKFARFLDANIGQVANLYKIIKDNAGAIFKSITYIILAVLLVKLINVILKFSFKKSSKTRTIINLISSTIKYAALIVTLWLVLKSFGVDTTTLLASAGVIVLIVGLGAQSLIEDVIAGLSIVFENEYEVDDIVIIDNFRGSIIDIGLRTTKILDLSGNIKIVNNSDIRNVINMSRGLAYVIVEGDYEYDTDIAHLEKCFNEDKLELAKMIPEIQGELYFNGVTNVTGYSVRLRYSLYCNEDLKFPAERSLKKVMKIFSDKHGFKFAKEKIIVETK